MFGPRVRDPKWLAQHVPFAPVIEPKTTADRR